MVIIRDLFGLLLLAVSCLGDHHETVSGEETLKCPGVCQEAGSCLASLTETDCSENLICCVDHLDKMAATEFADFELTTESLLDSNLVQEVSDEEHPGFGNEGNLFGTSEAGELETTENEGSSEDGYQVVFSDESDEAVLSSLPEELIQTVNEGNCPGTCVATELAENCAYIVPDIPACAQSICCITEDFQQEGETYEYVPDSSQVVKRSTNRENGYNCPGACVHPMHALQCQNILNQYSCPLNTKCCVFSNMKSAVQELTECTGMCVPARMAGYCVPPNELVRGPSSCPPGQSCCMRTPSNLKSPQFASMSQNQQPGGSNEDILGHLAVDEMGTVFKVTNRGDVFPLQKMPPNANLFDFMKIGAYQRPEGELVIYSDKSGNLYQQLYPYQPSSKNSAASSLLSEFSSKPELLPDNVDGVSDVVIPEDGDEAPVSTSKPVIHSDQNSRPSCPGSCISYFLRFTCFRGFAIYDGFTCPSRSVCCARLEDIEEHEQYLKSLSPYFNVPPASRDSNIPRCGIKGQRDTPRVMGGKDSLPGEWCWQVAIINLQNQYICGGVLIDDSWVLTAAHCVIGPMEEGQAIFVRAGVTDLKSSEDNNKAQTIKVLSTFVHHNFNSLNLDNNIALLRLQKPVILGSNVCVVCLPTNLQMPTEGAKCTVTGYGFVSPDGGMSLRIREAQVPIVDDMECMANVTEVLENPFLLPASSFCAGGEGIKDACQGDAGGALACEIDGFHELIGLVSWGLGCGRDYVPSVYVKVPAFMGWINQIISSSSFFIP